MKIEDVDSVNALTPGIESPGAQGFDRRPAIVGGADLLRRTGKDPAPAVAFERYESVKRQLSRCIPVWCGGDVVEQPGTDPGLDVEADRIAFRKCPRNSNPESNPPALRGADLVESGSSLA